MRERARPGLVARPPALFFERDAEGAVAEGDAGSDAATDVDVDVLWRRRAISSEDPDAAGAVVELECGANALDAEGGDHAALNGDVVVMEVLGVRENFGNCFCAAAGGEYGQHCDAD